MNGKPYSGVEVIEVVSGSKGKLFEGRKYKLLPGYRVQL